MGADELLGAGRGFGTRRLARTRAALVVVQVTIALVLLVGAGLLVRTMRSIGSTSVGFDTSAIATFGVTLPAARYADATAQGQFETTLLDRLRRIEGVLDATAAGGTFPTGFAPQVRIELPAQDETGNLVASYFAVAPDFFAAVQIPVRGGRELARTDTAQSPGVVVVNDFMARRWWPAGNAIGSRFRIAVGPRGREVTVVGIVGDVRQDGPSRDLMPTMYVPLAQQPGPSRTFALRTTRSLADVRTDVRTALQAIDPLLPLPSPQSVDRRLETQVVQQQFATSILTAFAAFAAGLCALGLYAVVAMTAQARRREFALRMALGAQRHEVSWLVLRQSLWLVGAGAVVGLGTSLVLTRSLRALLHGIEPTDPISIAMAIAAVVAVAIAAAVKPAWRSTRIDPVSVLKSQ